MNMPRHPRFPLRLRPIVWAVLATLPMGLAVPASAQPVFSSDAAAAAPDLAHIRYAKQRAKLLLTINGQRLTARQQQAVLGEQRAEFLCLRRR